MDRPAPTRGPSRSARFRRGLGHVAVIVVVVYGGLLSIAWLRVVLDDDRRSRSHGTATNGWIERAHVLPPSGPGFTTYSILGAAAGRQYVHGEVRALLLGAFADAAEARPGTTFVVAETGWPGGGPLDPHHSHENGTSVDVLVPMLDGDTPRALSSWPWDHFGYGHELDDDGRLGSLALDVDALAALLCALEARGTGDARVRRIILTPPFQPRVEAAMPEACRRALSSRWMREEAWWRHDEHVHVDFDVD